MQPLTTIATVLVDHRRIALVLLLVSLSAVGAGVTHLEQDSSLQEFEVGSPAEARMEYVESNFSTGPGNATVVQVVVRDDDVLDRETLLATLDLQRAIRANETVAPTLWTDRPTAGVANVVATAAIRRERPWATDPSLAQQRTALAAIDQQQVDTLVGRVLDSRSGARSGALAFMPDHYEPGTTTANATMVVAFQTREGPSATGNAPDRIVESQASIEALAADRAPGEDVIVVGNGVVTDEMEQSRRDTFAIVGPLALAFVLLTLVVVYRDLVDILLSLVGIVLVQLWTFGTLGWAGVAFNPVLIAVPVLLVGLSIDYGIHVFTRYREHRSTVGTGVGESMRAALSGVGPALVWVTATTVVGFLSNLASPVAPIRDLGLISAVGIVGALVVFGAFLPALKVELDALLERAGLDRRQRPLGTGGGRLARLLSVGSTAARRAPVAVVLVALVVTGVAVVGATQVSTSFEPEDNVPDAAPAWTERLPGPMKPGEYTARSDLRYVNERFVRPDSRVHVLAEGDVTAPGTLDRVAAAEREAAARNVTVILADGEPETESLLTVIDRVAAENESFNATVAAADVDGDGIPDRNLEAVYDHLYAVAPDRAARVLHRADGEYRALRVGVAVEPDADGGETVEQMGAVAGHLDGEGLTAAATGDPVVNQVIKDYLLETLLASLVLTLLVVLAILAAVYRLVHGSATLGVVTLLPVAASVAWIVATMYTLGYPLSVLTTVVASITVGIGIDYGIHVSERFSRELHDGTSVEEAIKTTIRGTGSALLGSAATTAAGFGVLAFALFPVLRQFGTITAIMIVYAFLGSVLVLPSLLVLWARVVDPAVGPARTVGHDVRASETVDD